MQVGDQVKLVGVVKEIVTDKNTTRVSVLLGTLDAPGNPSHEYWVGAADLVSDLPAAQAAAAPGPHEPTATPPGAETAAPPAHQTAGKHSSSHT